MYYVEGGIVYEFDSEENFQRRDSIETVKSLLKKVQNGERIKIYFSIYHGNHDGSIVSFDSIINKTVLIRLLSRVIQENELSSNQT